MRDIQQVLEDLDKQEVEAMEALKRAFHAYFENMAAIRGARQALKYILEEDEQPDDPSA